MQPVAVALVSQVCGLFSRIIDGARAKTLSCVALALGGVAVGCGSMTGPGVPIAVAGGRFSELSAGGNRTCGITPSGAAYCWGQGVQVSDSSAVPVAVRGVPALAIISAGDILTCGLTSSGAAYCWGGIFALFNGPPSAVDGGPSLAAITVGDHVCGLTLSGTAYCWGQNREGELGTGTTTDSPLPAAVSGGLTYGSISASTGHTCGLTAEGAAYCWGSNWEGQLGVGSTAGPQQCFGFPCSTTPVAVAGSLTFVMLSTGFDYTCGLTATGAGYCWGQNAYGQLGVGSRAGPQQCVLAGYNGVTVSCSTTPVPVAGGLTFVTLSVGLNHACGLTSGGAAYCWGENKSGELGTGSTMDSPLPTAVTGGLHFVAISAGSSHTCGLTRIGMAYCWGANLCGSTPGTFDCSGVP